VFADTQPPEKGGVLPEIILSVPSEAKHQTYLGVTGKSRFAIPQIKADVVLIMIYSMYCPFCQNDAPVVNKFYRKVSNDPSLKEKIKLLGIAAGNSAFEVDVFAKKFDVKFPLFPDNNFSIHKMLGEVRTPYFIGVKMKKDGTHTVFYSKLGEMEDADKFLKSIISLSGL
jgi:thiol-disulfide isomerase/thioredoxin